LSKLVDKVIDHFVKSIDQFVGNHFVENFLVKTRRQDFRQSDRRRSDPLTHERQTIEKNKIQKCHNNVFLTNKTNEIYLIFNFYWRKVSRKKNDVGDDSTDDDQKVGIGRVNASCGLLGGQVPVRGLNPEAPRGRNGSEYFILKRK
jgi:hypothetical protein